MVIVKGLNGLLCLQIRGKHGYSGGLGFISMGLNLMGEDDFSLGNYRNIGRGKKRKQELIISYQTQNPRTSAQQSNRQRFSDYVDEWRNLTAQAKFNWRKSATRRGKSGYTYFISARMRNIPD